MHTISVREARKNLHHLIDNIATSNASVIITSHRNTAVLLSSKDWAALQETLHLHALPGMHSSIIERLKLDEEVSSQ